MALGRSVREERCHNCFTAVIVVRSNLNVGSLFAMIKFRPLKLEVHACLSRYNKVPRTRGVISDRRYRSEMVHGTS